jgi:hypothetical protein
VDPVTAAEYEKESRLTRGTNAVLDHGRDKTPATYTIGAFEVPRRRDR